MLHVYVFCCALDECGRGNETAGHSRSEDWTISQIENGKGACKTQRCYLRFAPGS